VNIWRGLFVLAKTARGCLASVYKLKIIVGGYSPLSAAKLSLNRGAAIENTEKTLAHCPVLQSKAKSLPEDFQVKEGVGSEHEEINTS
jgi:hypothetical protein